MNINPDPQTAVLPGAPMATSAGQTPTPAAVWMGRLLASSATALSLAVSGLVGWQRGGTQAAQVLLAAIGILAVLGAHWLLPLLRSVQAGIVPWLIGILLWLACLIYAATSHADFFIDVQAQRADQRIAGMASETLATATLPKRSLPAILEEEAGVRVKWMQARFAEASCETNCETFKIRQVALKSRVAALEAEEEETRRWDATQDELRRHREVLRDDPVALRLKRDFGVTAAGASAVTVLPVAAMLEGLGALCWCLVLRGRSEPVTSDLTQAVATTVASRVAGTVAGDVAASPVAGLLPEVTPTVMPPAIDDVIRHDDVGRQEVQALAAKVWVEIAEGRVRPSVKAIRAELRIAQHQARAVAQVIRVWLAAGTVHIGPNQSHQAASPAIHHAGARSTRAL